MVLTPSKARNTGRFVCIPVAHSNIQSFLYFAYHSLYNSFPHLHQQTDPILPRGFNQIFFACFDIFDSRKFWPKIGSCPLLVMDELIGEKLIFSTRLWSCTDFDPSCLLQSLSPNVDMSP